MDLNRKKELLEDWKNRRPEMGVISIVCKPTGDLFLGVSKDTSADFNSIRFKLATSWYPNKKLQALWNEYGNDGFEFSVLEKLKYENPSDDYTDKLEEMLEKQLSAHNKSERL